MGPRRGYGLKKDVAPSWKWAHGQDV
jgi:hypothetical protein